MKFKNIIVEKNESIATIWINRPKVLNALNIETIEELSSAISDLENDSKIHVVVLTGKGKAFIAGADINQMYNMTPLEAKKFAENGHNMLLKIEKSRLQFFCYHFSNKSRKSLSSTKSRMNTKINFRLT